MSITTELVFVVLVLICRPTTIISKAAATPNVLFIVVDDLRPTLGCYGDPIAATPNIDSLARKSVVFDRAYVQQALGGPSRTSFLTGRRPDTTRVYDNNVYWRHHAGNYTTLPQHFKENGYLTQSFGSVFQQGKASNWTDDFPYSWSAPPYHPPSKVYTRAKVCQGEDGFLGLNVICPVNVSQVPGSTLPDIQVTDFAIEFLRNRSAHREQPFFLGVGFQKPGIPFMYPREYLELYPMSEMHLAPNPTFPELLPIVAWNPWTDIRDFDDVKALNVSFPFGPLQPDFQLKMRQSYYASTSYVDALVGRLLEALDKNGLAGSTAIILIGDNGVSLGEHQEWSKYSNYEVSVKVPLMVYVPELTSQVTVAGSNFPFRDALANTQDYRPQAIKKPRQEQPFVISSQLMSKMISENLSRIKRRVLRRLLSFPDDLSSDQTASNSSWNVHLQPTVYPFLQESKWRQIFKGSVLPFITKIGTGFMQRAGTSKASLDYRLSLHIDKHLSRGLQVSSVPSQFPLATMALVELVDLFPTLVDIAGLPVPPPCPTSSLNVSFCSEGSSFLPVIQNMLRSFQGREKSSRIAELPPSRPWHAGKQSVSGVQWKSAAFSQFPRPRMEPDTNSDQPSLQDVRIMGYSMRTHVHRYTEWVAFDPASFSANWTHVYAKELYLHDVDPNEDHNEAYSSQYAALVERLALHLREGWRHHQPLSH